MEQVYFSKRFQNNGTAHVSTRQARMTSVPVCVCLCVLVCVVPVYVVVRWDEKVDPRFTDGVKLPRQRRMSRSLIPMISAGCPGSVAKALSRSERAAFSFSTFCTRWLAMPTSPRSFATWLRYTRDAPVDFHDFAVLADELSKRHLKLYFNEWIYGTKPSKRLLGNLSIDQITTRYRQPSSVTTSRLGILLRESRYRAKASQPEQTGLYVWPPPITRWRKTTFVLGGVSLTVPCASCVR
jgi:hypothetical protein